MKNSKAYLAGFKTGTTHTDLDKNPYAPNGPAETDEAMDWEEGWMAGDAGGHKALMTEAAEADARVREEEGDD